MKAYILPLHAPSPPWVGSKHFSESSQVKTFFSKVVMLHTKLKGMELREPCMHIFYPYTHPQPVGRFKRKKKTSECGHVAYQIKGKEV